MSSDHLFSQQRYEKVDDKDNRGFNKDGQYSIIHVSNGNLFTYIFPIVSKIEVSTDDEGHSHPSMGIARATQLMKLNLESCRKYTASAKLLKFAFIWYTL